MSLNLRLKFSILNRFQAHKAHRYLGDGDPNIQALFLGQHQDTNTQEVISLNIPGLETFGGAEDTITERDISVIVPEGESTRRTQVSDTYSAQDEEGVIQNINNSAPVSSQEDGSSYITSTHYLKDKISPGRTYYRASYVVNNEDQEQEAARLQNQSIYSSKCTNVTAVNNRPVVSSTARPTSGVRQHHTLTQQQTRSVGPVSSTTRSFVSPAERQVGYVNRQAVRPISGNSIRKLAREKENSNMSVIGGNMYSSQHYTNTSTTTTSTHVNRVQEKEELQRLNDRFSLYIQRVRQLREQSGQIDSASFLKSAKLLEDEVSNLKNLYESELHNLR